MSKARTWDQYIHELLGRPELDYLRKEFNRITTELAKIDLKKHLSPSAQKRVKAIEHKYHDLSKTLYTLQDQVDDEFKWALKKLKTTKKSLEGSFKAAQKSAVSQKKNIEKLSGDLAKRIKKLATTKAKSKKTTRKKA